MQKHIQHNKDKRHSSLEKYISYFIWKGSKGLLKVLLCERWVGDWTELQHIDLHTLMAITAFLSHSPGLLNRGPGGPGPSFSRTWSSFQDLLSNSSELKLLNRGSWGPLLLGAGSLYSILSPTASNFLCTELYYCFMSTQSLPITGQRNMQLLPSLE